MHVDTRRVDVPEVKAFLRRAFYRRFVLVPEPEFIEPSTGGGVVGVRLGRFDRVGVLEVDG